MKIEIRLKQEYFDRVKNGQKVVEMTLYDGKRRELKVGDTITFVSLDDEKQKVRCEIVNLLVYKNFEELYADYDPVDLGYGKGETASHKDMEEFYSKEEQEKNGVLAIEIEVI